MLDAPPIYKDDGSAPDLASKQHGMWIVELSEITWSNDVCTAMNAFKKKQKVMAHFYSAFFFNDMLDTPKKLLLQQNSS